MKNSFLPVHKIIVATIAGISFASMLVAEPTLADTTQPFGSLQSDQNSNALSGNGSGFDIMNTIIHQAQIGTVQWNADQQSQQLDLAATAFRAAQQKLLQPQIQQNSGALGITSGQNLFPLQILPSTSK
ncbi:hypothetical protein MEN41_17915 [Dolichospermum sp. ST_con]|jgi:hypothetical protein|nr:hypothetical protein [Dolichospermum sp. ST_con]MDD1422282.1 hypothetical protein [Dolichospermum sp. ST_sed1]MDD1428073.1 hypothetical protein [Dolichospermum sp. ST_sed9]MDD1432976.1 hypothetical protein [Dolichospermum sp. ST_sed6]MDD1442414.1 hypothetical protein [Dolichospermum sp. ST_sed3]MDD1446695.1 hypothetical protein [Dolichospermum sp. ST_sed8]MDD1454888.1 hypothetical protein [Dolichospermum sp. ST_sed7]MDD1463109.1 hypothetical protein [Dolichospermum sp. ST_sed2]MDD1468252